MGVFDRLVVLAIFLGVGITLTAGQCQNNQTLIAEINGTVTGFQALLDQIMASGLPTDQMNNLIFNIACFNETYAPQVTTIAAAVTACPPLIPVTNIGTLMFGSLGFTNILTLFPTGGLQEFCNCSSYLTNALALQPMNINYKLAVMNGQWANVGNLGFFCDESFTVQGVPMPMNIRMMLNMTLMGLDMSCPRVYALAGMTNSMQAMKVRNYLAMCPMFNQTAFSCAVEASKATAFKSCVNGITTDNDNEKACATYDCMKDHITSGNGNCGSDATTHFIRALDIELTATDPDRMREDEVNCDTSAAKMVAISLTSLFASLLLMFII